MKPIEWRVLSDEERERIERETDAAVHAYRLEKRRERDSVAQQKQEARAKGAVT